MSELPRWVMDLVMKVQEYEDVHPSSPDPLDTLCHGEWLALVPLDVQGRASAIREYLAVPHCPHDDASHICRGDGKRRSFCRQSCTACMGDAVKSCLPEQLVVINHKELKA